jgi:hypothetical protein
MKHTTKEERNNLNTIFKKSLLVWVAIAVALSLLIGFIGATGTKSSSVGNHSDGRDKLVVIDK